MLNLLTRKNCTLCSFFTSAIHMRKNNYGNQFFKSLFFSFMEFEDEGFSFFILGYSQFEWAKGESKNWEYWKMKIGKANSVLKLWNKTCQLGTQLYLTMSLVLCLSDGCQMDVTCISDFSMWYHNIVNLLSKIWYEKCDIHVILMWYAKDQAQ